MKSTVLAVLMLALVGSLAAAEKKTDHAIFATVSSLKIKECFTKEGFKGGEIDGDDDLLVTMEGYRVIALIGSNDYTCVQLRLSIRAKATLEIMNDWNRRKKYTKAYLDGDGDPVLEMDIDLTGGVTEDRIRDGIKTFAQSIPMFIKELG